VTPLIAVENLSYAYPPAQPGDGPEWVLDGVDFQLNEGEFVALMSRTGSGKTTLCLALNGIVPHSTGGIIGGDVFVQGVNSKRATVPLLARQVGVVFQDPETQIFNLTVEMEVAFGLETLGIPPPEIRERVDWALDMVGMSRLLRRSPHQLSGGQKQRVAIAAIVAMLPKVLVLDEPTASLDPEGKIEVFEAIRRLKQQQTMSILMVSDEAEQIAEFADRVLVLADGKIKMRGTVDKIFSRSETLMAMGLSTPQVCAVASGLNRAHGTAFDFATLPAACAALKSRLPAASNRDVVVFPEKPPPETSTVILEAEDVAYAYGGEIPALNGLSLRVHAGELLAITGRNGSGKTTFARHLNGLLRPDSGQVRLHGENTAKQTVAALSRHVGYVFQNPDHQIFNDSVWEEIATGPRNLGFSAAMVKTRVEEAMAQFGLEALAGKPPSLLSFGWRKLVSIASVYAMGTEIFVLDEPGSGLDRDLIGRVMQVVNEFVRQGGSVLMITHDMRLIARHAGRCVVFDNGMVLADSTPRHIYQDSAMLEQAGLQPPQVTRLGQCLPGMPDDLLTVAEFCVTYAGAAGLARAGEERAG